MCTDAEMDTAGSQHVGGLLQLLRALRELDAAPTQRPLLDAGVSSIA
jgi:hypothetical protein